MYKIILIVLFTIICLPSYGQKATPKNTGSSTTQETSKSKSSSKLYERSGKDILVSALDRLNSPFNEYYIAPYKDGVVYSVIKSSGTPTNSGDVLFYYSKIKDGKYGNPEKFELNTPNTIIPLAVSFDHGNQLMFITCLDHPADINNKTVKADRYHIYQANMKANKWDNWTELPFSKTLESAGFAVVNAASNTLYFSAKDQGSTNGFDIYTATKSKDTWANAKKMGGNVNSSMDEMRPAVYNNSLFYSSNGKGGFGKFDLFLFDLAAKEAESYNLDANFNTDDNDLFFLLLNDNKNGYLINDHKKNTKGDLYSFKVNGAKGFIN
ncbi:MAG TPA: hypothetical protein VK590_01580 [Saprospiraceae bacterium]|nr:hypothetical protein [Saprospiraceae bacterium]